MRAAAPDLMEAALDEGCILKDATPFNVSSSTPPVFIDVASIVRLLPARRGWGIGSSAS